MQHLHSLFVMCVPTRVQSFIPAGCLGGVCFCAPTCIRPNFATPAGAAPTRVQSFIPAGCLVGVCNSPLHVSGQTSLPPQGPPLPRGQSFIPAGCLGGECNSPLHGYPAKLRCPRRGRPYHGYNHSSLRDVWGGVCNTPLPGYTPFMYPAKFAGVRRRPPPPPLPIIRDCECVAPWPTFATLFLT